MLGNGPKRYLVTGGCGFIGSHLADRLVALGHDVRILDDLSTGKRANAPPEAELVIGDVADETATRSAMRDVAGCFHLAAIASVALSNEAPVATHRVNLVGTLVVLGAAARYRVPVVYASSAAVYGAEAAPPVAEESATRPLSVYGADKLACELQAQVASHLHGLSTVGLRLFNVYGPRQDPSSPYSGVISIFAKRLGDGRAVTILGDGEQVRDFVHVGDVVEIFIAAMAAREPGAAVCNVCTGSGTSIRALAELIGESLDIRPEILHGPPRAGDIRRSIGDPRRALQLYGLAPQTSLREGLRHLLHAPLETSAIPVEDL